MNVLVRNTNSHPFEQKFKGVIFKFAPGEAKEMDLEEANEFLGAYVPFKVDKNGQHNPKFFKKFELECPTTGHKARTTADMAAYLRKINPEGNGALEKFRCMACSEQTSSWQELEAHIRLMHPEQLSSEGSHGAKASVSRSKAAS